MLQRRNKVPIPNDPDRGGSGVDGGGGEEVHFWKNLFCKNIFETFHGQRLFWNVFLFLIHSCKDPNKYI